MIATGLSSTTVPVFYADVANDVRSVFVIITGPLPTGLKRYRLVGANEDECSFGHVGFATIAPNGMFAYESEDPVTLLTRATVFRLPETSLPRKIRLSLWQNLTWSLWDSGER